MLLRTIVGILAIALVTKLGPAWAGWLTVLLVAFWIWRAIPVKNDYMRSRARLGAGRSCLRQSRP